MKLEAKFSFLLTLRNVFCTCFIQEGDVRACAWRGGLRFECWLNKGARAVACGLLKSKYTPVWPLGGA